MKPISNYKMNLFNRSAIDRFFIANMDTRIRNVCLCVCDLIIKLTHGLWEFTIPGHHQTYQC